MKIYHVFYQKKKYGGSESYVEMLQAYSKYEHQVVYVKDRYPKLPSIINTYLGFDHLIKELKGKNEDCIVHSHFFMSGYLAERYGLKSVTTSHSLLSEEYKLSLYDTKKLISRLDLYFSYVICRFWEKRMYPKIKNLMVISDFHKQELENMRAKPLKIQAPIDLRLFKAEKKRTNNKEFILLFLARPTYLKGLHVLTEALNLIDKSLPIKLMIVGDSYKWMGNYLCYQPCVKSTNDDSGEFLFRMKADKNRIVIKKEVCHKDIQEYFAACDALVCPSLYESLGFVNMEAMACGRPVIASSAGGITEIVKDGDNGLIFENNNPKNLAEKILLLYSNKDLLNKLSKNALNFIKNYDFQKHIRIMDGYYEEIYGRN